MANTSKFLMAAGAAGAAVGRSGAVPALLSRVFHAAVTSRSLAPIAIATANIATSASVSAPTSGPTPPPPPLPSPSPPLSSPSSSASHIHLFFLSSPVPPPLISPPRPLQAWRLTDPHAKEAFTAIRDAGVKIAVVSNFDTRLRTVLKELECHDWFDAIAVSAEIQAEKPNPVIFHSACDLVGVDPHHAVHVGDDRRNDLWGARDAGCSAWLWQDDVHSFHDVARKLGVLFRGEEESPEANKRRMRRPPRWAERPMIAANGLQFLRH
ncbi:unnamed protein product [Closterium sp. Naga37s-1]|nr:unnamed protein product [Closterium sp. Naga37s-1]